VLEEKITPANDDRGNMPTKPKPWAGVKTYRPSLRSYSFAAHTANAIAERERRQDEQFSGHSHGPASGAPQSPAASRLASPGFSLARCCAYDEQSGMICGVSPAPFLDFQRGGFVCADHKPERGPS